MVANASKLNGVTSTKTASTSKWQFSRKWYIAGQVRKPSKKGQNAGTLNTITHIQSKGSISMWLAAKAGYPLMKVMINVFLTSSILST